MLRLSALRPGADGVFLLLLQDVALEAAFDLSDVFILACEDSWVQAFFGP